MEPADAPAGAWRGVVRGALLCGTFAALGLFIRGPFLVQLHNAAKGWAHAAAVGAAALGPLLVCFRLILWFRYRSAPAATWVEAVPLTVIIPAYNEGAMVLRSIESVATADYPRDRLRIIVIDDGSTDDTWEHVHRAASRHPGLVTAIRFPRNRGKRAALEAGFRSARGEVVVTIDSDSVIEPGSLLAMVGPFRNPRVGAVAGKVAVYNRRSGLLPRMLHVRFLVSFDMLRAVQSVYRTVYCCPGALAAYRSTVVRDVLEEWRGQSFLGVSCTYGEDRALTNYILERGYDTVYQSSAVVHTLVPTTFAKLVRMYLRWERSHVREQIRFARIVWKRPLAPRLLALFDGLLMGLRYPLGYLATFLFITVSLNDPAAILRILAGIAIGALLHLLVSLRSDRSEDFLYGVLYAYFAAFTLFWLFPYAALTVRSRSWMTR